MLTHGSHTAAPMDSTTLIQFNLCLLTLMGSFTATMAFSFTIWMDCAAIIDRDPANILLWPRKIARMATLLTLILHSLSNGYPSALFHITPSTIFDPRVRQLKAVVALSFRVSIVCLGLSYILAPSQNEQTLDVLRGVLCIASSLATLMGISLVTLSWTIEFSQTESSERWEKGAKGSEELLQSTNKMLLNLAYVPLKLFLGLVLALKEKVVTEVKIAYWRLYYHLHPAHTCHNCGVAATEALVSAAESLKEVAQEMKRKDGEITSEKVGGVGKGDKLD